MSIRSVSMKASKPVDQAAYQRDDDLGGLVHLLEDLGINATLNSKIPVNIGDVAKAFGAIAVKEAEIPAAGMLVPTDDKFIVLLNKHDIAVRKRYSCAHEVAHAIFDPKYNFAMRKTSESATNSMEIRCEKLASLLLMPEPLFTRYVNHFGSSIESISKLSRIFQTSVQATAIRVVDGLDHACVLIVSKMTNGKSGRKLRVRWSHQNSVEADSARKYFIPKGKSIGAVSVKTAFETGNLQSDVGRLDIGELRTEGYTESRAFGRGKNRYVLTLVFPKE